MRTLTLLILTVFFFSCSEDNDDSTNNNDTAVSFKFSHHWDGTTVTNTDFNIIQYTNANGEDMSIERLRYLISNITLQKQSGETLNLNGYNLIDLTNNTNLTYTPETRIPLGTYSNVSFTFGFNNDYNYQNYQDLNSANWNVPEMLGGGYHYMQLEGKFIDNMSLESNYAYHAIRAVDTMSNPELTFQDTFIVVNLGEITITENTNIEVMMNIAEWFKTPNTWDLNILSESLMGNFDAQIMMYENGQNVFSLGTITP